MKTISVDSFVKSKVPAEFRPVVILVRAIIKKYAPEATEYLNNGAPTYKGKRIIAVINATKTDLNITFPRGAEFVDQFGLLEGNAKVSRNIKLTTVAAVNQNALRHYIKQALKLDAK